MKTFDYVITDEVGLHARPTGMLVKEAKQFQSKITIRKNEKSADATKMLMLMGMGVKCGDTVTVEVDGADEETAVETMQAFFEKNL